MENWRHTLIAAVVVPMILAAGAPSMAQSLSQRLPNLFGGAFGTSVAPGATTARVKPLISERFRDLSAEFTVARTQVPIPSASGPFSFALPADYDAYVRIPESLGSVVAERAQPLGQSTATVGVAFSRVVFSTLDGKSLDHLDAVQPALSEESLRPLPPGDQARARDNVIRSQLAVRLAYDQLYLTMAYGLTDAIDVSATLSLVHVSLRATATAQIEDPNSDMGAFFTNQQKGVVDRGEGGCSLPFTCAQDAFSDSADGVGDIILRSKWRLATTKLADMAVGGLLTIPTGGADEFLGYDGVTFTPRLIASKSFGRISPHLNLGYAVRSDRDGGRQGQWLAGADARVTSWLTLASDFLGFHDDGGSGRRNDILQSALSIKVNVLGDLVLGGTVQFPLNRDGLRADVIYGGQAEYAF